jgi:TPR repeat protein
MKRVKANDPAAICVLANHYYNGERGIPQDHTKGMEHYARSADLGFCNANYNLACIYHKGGDMKKAKFHFEAAAMAGHDVARDMIGCLEAQSGNIDRAVKHWSIAASAGNFFAMNALRLFSRESIDSTLAAYNSACAEMRSDARDAIIRFIIGMNGSSTNATLETW